MSLKRTISAPSQPQLCHSFKRRRRASKRASKFQLLRPTGPAPTPKIALDVRATIHEHQEPICLQQECNEAPGSNPSHASVSLPSMKITTDSTSDLGESTPQSPKPTQENQNKTFSIQKLSHINPLSFTQSCLRAYKIREECYEPQHQQKNFFLEVTEEHLAAYQADVISAVRQGDVETLRSIKKSGRSLQGCNRYGESVMHIACRRGSPKTVSFLINEGGCSLRIKDDFGRTPLHDACWQTEPDFNLIEIILDVEPSLLLHRDKRGHTCLEYARRENWGAWIQYLSHRMKKEIRRQLNTLNGETK